MRQGAASSLIFIDYEPIKQEAMKTLIELLSPNYQEDTRLSSFISLYDIDPDNEDVINTAIELLLDSQEEDSRQLAAYFLRCAGTKSQKLLPRVVTALKSSLQAECRTDCYEALWRHTQNMTYPAFYQAWHQQEEIEKTTTSASQSLNQADLPQNLQTAITNDPQLNQTIHLICIDTSQFIDLNNPAPEIYDQMLDQNCPECDSVPKTMPALKMYWNSIKRKSNKSYVLVFYASFTNLYNESFLTALSKFGGNICVIIEQRLEQIPLKLFAPSQPIEDLLEWVRTK